MTLPVVEDVTTQLFATPATTHNVTQPATVNANDLLIAIFAVDGTTNTITWDNSPDTWTNLVANDGFGSQNWSIWYRVADGTEDGETLAIGVSASQDAVSAIVRVSGIDTGTAPEVAIGSDVTSATQDPPSITPSWGAADGLVLAVVCSGSSIMTAPTYPSGYSNTGYIDGGAAGTVFIAYAAKQITGSSEDPGAFVMTASQSGVAYTIAVKGATASSTLTDVDTDEAISTGQSGIAYTGTGLTNADEMRIYTGTEYAAGSAFVATNATSGTFTAPTLSAVLAAGVKFGTVTFDIRDGGVSLGTLSGTLNPESGWTVHNVTDISGAADEGCIYYGASPAVAVGDQFIFENAGGSVTINSTGFLTFGDGVTETNYYAWDDTDNTWSGPWNLSVATAVTGSGIVFIRRRRR